MSTYLQSALKKKKEKLINASEARRPTAQVIIWNTQLTSLRPPSLYYAAGPDHAPDAYGIPLICWFLIHTRKSEYLSIRILMIKLCSNFMKITWNIINALPQIHKFLEWEEHQLSKSSLKLIKKWSKNQRSKLSLSNVERCGCLSIAIQIRIKPLFVWKFSIPIRK
jgi:hypothetical protein